MLNIEPVKQSEGCCGPAVLKMVLSFYGINKTEEELIKLTKTDIKGYTTEEDLVRCAELSGLKGLVKTDSSFDELKVYLDKGVPVIIDWTSPEEGGHYSVVAGLDNEMIYVADPHFGEIMKYEKMWFEQRWRDSFADKEILKEVIIIEK